MAFLVGVSAHVSGMRERHGTPCAALHVHRFHEFFGILVLVNVLRAVSAKRLACRIPMAASMRCNCSTAKDRRLKLFTGSNAIMYSAWIREIISGKIGYGQLRS